MVPLNAAAWLIAVMCSATVVCGDVQNSFHVNLESLLYGRMDPIVDPGKVSAHAHNIFGANNFRSVLNSPEELLAADCTTADISADKSNYWAPVLYFINDDNKYEPLMPDGGRAYYFTRGKAAVFPQGFRMIAGVANSRDPYRPQMASHSLGYTIGSPPNNAISGVLYLPNTTSQKDAFKQFTTTITFPSCGWANQSLDTAGHQLHMTYPEVVMGGGVTRYDPFGGDQCPPSHPIKYANIHLEVYYKVSEAQQKMWTNGKMVNRLILANGDTMGLSMHADYVFGWDEDVYKTAINCPNPMADDNDCGGGCKELCPYSDGAKGRNCRFVGMLPDEDLGWNGGISALPGCNKRWDSNMGETKPTDCDGIPGNPGWVAPNAYYQRDARHGVPVAFDTDGKGLASFPLTNYQSSDDKVWWEAYDNMTFCCTPAVAANPGKWNTGTDADIKANLDMSTATNKIDTVYGMKDASAFDSTQFDGPGGVAGQDAYAVTTVPSTISFILNGVASEPPPVEWYRTVGAANGGFGGGDAPAVNGQNQTVPDPVVTGGASMSGSGSSAMESGSSNTGMPSAGGSATDGISGAATSTGAAASGVASSTGSLPTGGLVADPTAATGAGTVSAPMASGPATDPAAATTGTDAAAPVGSGSAAVSDAVSAASSAAADTASAARPMGSGSSSSTGTSAPASTGTNKCHNKRRRTPPVHRRAVL